MSFTYDPDYNRIATMSDGTGTTVYAYNAIASSGSPGAGQLYSVDGPLTNDTIIYTYDQLSRQSSASVNGVAASQTYDALGRINTVTNPLGLFTNTYAAASRRLQNIALPNGQSATYSYFSNSGDKRLQTIQNKTATGAIISKFDYLYDADGEIMQLTKQLGATAFPITWNNGSNSMSDAADQLTNVVEQTASDTFATYSWSYDNAGNRTSDNGGTYSFNNVNQITNTGYTYDGNGNLTADPWRTFEWDAANRLTAINYPALGSRTEFTYDGLGRRVKIVEKNPTLNGVYQPANNQYTSFSLGPISLPAGNYTLTFKGLDPNGGDNTVFVDAVTFNGMLVPNGSFESPDIGPNYAYSGSSWTFAGDAGMVADDAAFAYGNGVAPDGGQMGFIQVVGSASQTVSLTANTYTLAFKAAQRAYGNASYQQIKVTLAPTDPIASTKYFIWNGNSIVEERDANNVVARRFYPQGEQISGANYYYMRDHLGSVRELTDSAGTVRARCDYDPYGYRTKLGGDLDAQFGFTGFYYHAPSGLNLALYRAYDFLTGRWPSRDPLKNAEISEGPNLYAYVQNNPINAFDPYGLDVHLNDPEYLEVMNISNADAKSRLPSRISYWMKE